MAIIAILTEPNREADEAAALSKGSVSERRPRPVPYNPYRIGQFTGQAMISVSGLSVYPVKSFAGVDQMSMHLTRDGPEYDRRWMLVDERGRFLTQRQLPKMALFSAALNDAGLELGLGTERYPVPLPQLDAGLRQVQVWGDSVQAQDTGGCGGGLAQRSPGSALSLGIYAWTRQALC